MMIMMMMVAAVTIAVKVIKLVRIYVIRFAKSGLPCTSNSMNLEDHNSEETY